MCSIFNRKLGRLIRSNALSSLNSWLITGIFLWSFVIYMLFHSLFPFIFFFNFWDIICIPLCLYSGRCQRYQKKNSDWYLMSLMILVTLRYIYIFLNITSHIKIFIHNIFLFASCWADQQGWVCWPLPSHCSKIPKGGSCKSTYTLLLSTSTICLTLTILSLF